MKAVLGLVPLASGRVRVSSAEPAAGAPGR
jgi:hypothetical protein